MATMTTRSQPRRRKVRQELVGTVPQAQLVSPFTAHRQVETSSAFLGGLAAATAVGKGVCRLQCQFGGSRWSRAQAGAGQEPALLHGGTEQPSLWAGSAGFTSGLTLA